jgi:spore coat polysaccharide biosynthesis protein SpsF
LVIATTNENDSDKIVKIGNDLNVKSYKGSVSNVLKRIYKISLIEQPKWIVRLTSDCPLIDPELIDRIINYALKNDFDYASNTLKPTYPDGLDVEVFKFSALEDAFKNAKLKSDFEHVTPYIWRNSSFFCKTKFISGSFECKNDNSKYRLTVDYIEDFELISELIKQLGDDLRWQLYVDFLKSNKFLMKINENILRNDGYINSIEND